MCEVAVCKGDDDRHAGTRNRMSRCECHVEVCERRGTWEFVRESATEMATDGQRPSSGRSCFGDRAGFIRQRARGSCRASHETAACASARMKPGPETPTVDVADPVTDRSSAGSGIWTGWVLHASMFVKLRRAEHMCSRGEPLEARGLLWDAQAARVVGIRQEENPCRMVPSEREEVREARTAAMTSRKKERGCELPRWCAGCELPRWWSA